MKIRIGDKILDNTKRFRLISRTLEFILAGKYEQGYKGCIKCVWGIAQLPDGSWVKTNARAEDIVWL